MLTFETIRYKNFLSTGNAWNKYDLNSHPHTLIIGTNGSGKTTLLDALTFGLYGKPFRNINKPTVVNSINEKNLVVEVAFTTQNNKYVVRRGLKPVIFDIICNGKSLPEFPSAIEMQDYLEKYILKCNYKAFTQVVILGASSYVPFMRLTPAARREILEDVLDIEVFSTMQSIVKGKLSSTKEELVKAQGAVRLIESQYALAKTYADQWQKRQEDERILIDEQIEKNSSQQKLLQEELKTPVEHEDKLRKMVDTLGEWQEKYTKATKLVSRFATERQHLTHNHKFFTENDQCPMCTQQIDENFKASKMGDAEEELKKNSVAYDEAVQIEKAVAKKLEQGREAQKVLHSIEVRRKQLEERIRSLERDVARLQDDRTRTYNEPPAPPTELGDLDAATGLVETHTYTKHVVEQCATLLKDTGIKSRIIKQYLPIINKWINHYLQSMDFPILFTLDDQFKETIKSRHRDEFSYENFSEGEKRRIDLALVMTWRAIARLKNSVYTNLLIFDEVFDGSLDASGTEDFLRLLHTLGADTNIFVISHKTDVLLDKFSQTVTVSKSKGFSVLTKS